MSIAAIGEEIGEEDFYIERTWKDPLIDKVSDLANLWMRAFWAVTDPIRSPLLPIHPDRYGHWEHVREVPFRIVALVVSAVTMMVVGVFAPFFSVLSAPLARPYRVRMGSFKGEVTDQKLFVLNPQMGPGFSPRRDAGLSSGEKRCSRLAATIRQNDPDIVFLPGVHTIFSGELAHALKDRYHFIFSEMGPNFFEGDASFFLAFRGELVRTPKYIPFAEQKRGYFTFETPDALYICTKKPSLNGLKEICDQDLSRKKVILMGDLGFEPDSPEYAFLVERGFASAVKEGMVTETNAPFVDFYRKEEEVTQRENSLLFIKGEKREAQVLSMCTDLIDEALSNHSAILV